MSQQHPTMSCDGNGPCASRNRHCDKCDPAEVAPIPDEPTGTCEFWPNVLHARGAMPPHTSPGGGCHGFTAQDNSYADECACTHLRVNHRDGQCFGVHFDRTPNDCRCAEFTTAPPIPDEGAREALVEPCDGCQDTGQVRDGGDGPWIECDCQTDPERLQATIALLSTELAEARRERDEAVRLDSEALGIDGIAPIVGMQCGDEHCERGYQLLMAKIRVIFRASETSNKQLRAQLARANAVIERVGALVEESRLPEMQKYELLNMLGHWPENDVC